MTLPARRTTLKSAVAPLADSQRTRPALPAERAIDGSSAPPDVSRAKTLKLDVARLVQRTRTGLNRSQTKFGADAGTSRCNVDRWEQPHDACAPNMMQLAIMPTDAALPLFAWCLAHHAQQVHAAPMLVHATDVARVADVTRAMANTGRAVACLLDGSADELGWQRIRTEAHRLANAAQELEQRAIVELEVRRRGR